MYVQQTDACSVRNSTTPVSQRKIARGQQILGRMNARAVTAQNAFAALLCRQDLNTNGWPLADQGGTPSACGTEGALPIGGNASSIATWPAQVTVSQVAQGVAPTTLSAYAAPPAPKMPSLVTQGHPRYDPATKKVVGSSATTAPSSTPVRVVRTRTHRPAPAPVPATPAPSTPAPVCTQYPYASADYINCVEALEQSGQKLTTSSQTFGSVFKAGMSGCDGSSPCDILLGMISALGLAAAGVYLYDYFSKRGGLSL